jgi:hypothetical protein
MMQRRQITLEDGRYLIFYTFDGAQTADAPEPPRAAGRKPEPQPQSEAEEERDV